MAPSAAGSAYFVAIKTDFPRSSSARPPRHDPALRSLKVTVLLASVRRHPDKSPDARITLHSDARSLGGIFVKPDELAHGRGKSSVLRRAERVDSQRVLQPGNYDCQAQ